MVLYRVTLNAYCCLMRTFCRSLSYGTRNVNEFLGIIISFFTENPLTNPLECGKLML